MTDERDRPSTDRPSTDRPSADRPPADDRDWAERLSGRETPDADPETRRQAELLRMAILLKQKRQAAEDQPLDDATLNQHWQRLHQRLKREGLLRRAPRTRRRRWLPALASAALLVVCVGVLLPYAPQWFGGEPPPGIGKGITLPQLIRVEQPEIAARRFADELEALGLVPVLTERDDRWYVSAPLDARPEGLRALLRRHGLDLPEDERLLIEFSRQ